MEIIEYQGWPNCIRLANDKMLLVVTTDVGPRVIHLGFLDGPNLLKQVPEHLGATGGPEWRAYGGHRLWHAPEAMPRTYAPDNEPVAYDRNGEILSLVQPVEKSTGIQKEIEITLDPRQNRVTLVHRLINHNAWAVELAPWCLTVMAPGGRAIIPQEPYRPHPEYLLPARPLVLWHYTDMADPRWRWSAKYVQLRQEPAATTKQKVGMWNSHGWAAYALNDDLFLKRFPCQSDANYPDFGCNVELFCDSEILEIESLGPITLLPPDGGHVTHVENWFLFKASVGEDDASIDSALEPLLAMTE